MSLALSESHFSPAGEQGAQGLAFALTDEMLAGLDNEQALALTHALCAAGRPQQLESFLRKRGNALPDPASFEPGAPWNWPLAGALARGQWDCAKIIAAAHLQSRPGALGPRAAAFHWHAFSLGPGALAFLLRQAPELAQNAACFCRLKHPWEESCIFAGMAFAGFDEPLLFALRQGLFSTPDHSDDRLALAMLCAIGQGAKNSLNFLLADPLCDLSRRLCLQFRAPAAENCSAGLACLDLFSHLDSEAGALSLAEAALLSQSPLCACAAEKMGNARYCLAIEALSQRISQAREELDTAAHLCGYKPGLFDQAEARLEAEALRACSPAAAKLPLRRI